MANYKLLNLLIHFYLCVVNVSSIHIKKNAYEGITISISESIQKKEFSIETLKTVLTKSSEFIYHATRKRSYFGEFIISLPSSWTAHVCDTKDFTTEISQKIDVYVTKSDQKRHLTTKHSRGCGLEGDRIDMPLEWIRENTDESSLARQFVQHWSIYRYGVFEEKTVTENSCYLSGKSWTPVGCYNIKSESEPRFEDGLPICSLPSNFFESSELKSSLMSDANSSKALDFCDGFSFLHNPAMPTLHNTLCKGRTVWSVIENSPDFKYGMNLPLKASKPPKSPVFKCFREASVHVTLAIQTNSITPLPLPVMQQLRTVLYKFLSNMAPEDTKVTLLTITDKEDSNAPFDIDIKNSTELEEQLLRHLKASKKINNTCLSCGFQKALNVTQYSSFSSPIVVVIALKSAVIDENPSVLINSIKEFSPGVRLHLILVEDTTTKDIPTDIIQAIRSQNGLIYFLPDELVFRASKLLGILAAVVKSPMEVEDRIVVVHERHYTDISQHFVDSFVIPSGKFLKMLYIMYCSITDPAVIRSDSSDCTSLSKISSSDTTFQCGEVWNFNNKKEKKTWEYPFSYFGSQTPLHCSSIAMLLSSPSSPSEDSFTLKGWLSEYVIKVPKNALTIYTEILGSSKHKFNVTAQISGPGLTPPALLELRDNGNGDPDTKSGDGIYSRYFTKFSKKGTYIVTVSAERLVNNADSFFVEEKRNQGVKLVQSKTIGFFYVSDTIPTLDTLPPNRVADLRVVSVNHDNRTAVLQWTAPGGNYDEGKAAAYEIKYSHQPSSLSEMYFNEDENFPLQPINANKPNMAGYTESIAFHFPQSCNRAVCYVALRAIDKNNNIGAISNTIQIYINQSEEEITITDPTDLTKLASSDPTSPDTKNITNDMTGETAVSTDTTEITSTSDDNSTALPPTCEDFFDKKTIIILSSSGSILLLIIIINIIICCCCLKKIKKSSKPKKISRKDSLRPPYNINIAYQEDDRNSSSNSGNFTEVSMNSLAHPNNYTAPEARTKPSKRKYSYHTDKSLQNKAQKDSELGFKIVRTQPAYATSSLSRYGTRSRESDTESETEIKSAIPQPQAPHGVKDAQVYPLGVV